MPDREAWDYSGAQWLDWDDLQRELARSVVRPRQPAGADIEAVSARIGEWMESRSGMEFPADWAAGERFAPINGVTGFGGQTQPITVTYRRAEGEIDG